MKRMLLFIVVLFSQQIIISQVLSEEAMKYWYYRDRLQYFVYPGTEEGASILMTSRNSNGNGVGNEPDRQYNGVEYGQTQRLNGYYLGMLATEYKLLKDNGQYADANRTLQELDLALDALIRMDRCEDLEPWNSTEYFDGFFIRNDVPPVLSANMTDYLNEGLLTGNYWDYQDAYLERPGIPFSIESNVVLCHRKYTNSSNYYYNNTPTSFDLPNYLSHGEKYWSYWKSDKFNSNDEIIGMYMGLALVGKYVDDQAVLDKSREIATRMRSFAIIHPSCTGSYGHSFQISPACIPFLMRYPDLTRIIDDNGGNSLAFIYGLIGACSKINDSGLGPLVPLLGGLTGLPSPYIIGLNIKSVYGGAVYYLSTFNNTNNDYNRPLYSILIATSDRTGNWLTPYYAIKTIGNENEHETFYLLLWADINDKDLTKKKFDFPFQLFMNQLQTAPCEGPYKYNWPIDMFPSGWACEYKFGASLSGQEGGSDRTGVFPGVDYMLLYNLACLAFPDGFDNNGTTYRFPYYVNQNNRSVTDEYAPMVLPGNNSVEIASTNNPEEIRAISSITTNMVISNRALMLTPAWVNAGQGNHYVDNVNGDVTLIAGESIRLTDGFRVDAGAHFLAKIESYSCNGLPYKNMNAPPWNENYRASFYDTLISVPRDQRIPIAYTNDDYSYENYDTPLCDDNYNFPDTGFTPELPLSAFLNPNPCSNKSILYIKPTSDQYLSIELFDICTQQGAIIFEGNSGMNNFEIEIDMTMYSAGIYIIRISGINAVKILKLMRE